MKEDFVAKDHFSHGGLGNVKRGQDLVLESSLGEALQRANLVERKVLDDYQNKMKPSHVGKSQAAGAEQPSSVSPVAQASPLTTARTFAAGVTRRAKRFGGSS